MTMNGFSLFVEVFILCAYHHTALTRVPSMLRLVIIQFLGKFLCRPRETMTQKKISPNGIEGQRSEGFSEEEKKSHNRPELSNVVLPPEVIELVKLELRKEKRQEELDHNKAEWELVATILDRLFVIIYYGMFISSGIYLTVEVQPFS